MFARLALAATLALGVAMPAAAFDISEMTEEERSAFRSEIRAYLLDNPEVLMEAISVLETREREAQAANDMALAANYADQLYDDGHSWVGGNPDGDVTIVEFLDYRCSYCRRAFDEVEALLASDGNIRFIVKEFPILGEQSALASQFAVAVLRVEGDEAYKNVHDALMTMRSDVTMSALVQMSDTFGFDTAAVSAEMQGEDVGRIIAENRALAQALAISGTPTFVIGDQLVRGYIPGNQMEQVVAEARAQQ